MFLRALFSRFRFLLLIPPLMATAAQRHVIALEQAYERTLASDQSIKTAWWEIKKADLLPLSALTVLGPKITASYMYLPSGRSGVQAVSSTSSSGGLASSTPSFSSTSVTTQTDVLRGSISYQQTLLDFTVFPAYRLGRLTDEATKLQYQNIVRQTLFGVAQAYYDVLKRESIADVNGETVKLAESQLDVAQKRFDLGDAARSDVLRARATLEDARGALIQAQTTLAISRNTLSNILNLGGSDEFRLVKPADATFTDEAFDKVLEQAYVRREDYKIAAIAIRQDEERHNQVRGGYAPRLVATVNQNWDSTHSGGSHGSSSSWDVSVGVQMPIFTGGQREIDLRTTAHQIEQTRLAYEKSAKDIQQEVKTAWLNVRNLRATIKAVRAALEAAEQNYKDLQAQYQAGNASSLDVDTALRDLNNTRTTLAGDVFDYQVTLRDLDRAQAAFQTVRVTKAATLFSSSTAKAGITPHP